MEMTFDEAAPKAAGQRLGALFDIFIWLVFLLGPSLALALAGVRTGGSPLLVPLFTLAWMVLLTFVVTRLMARRGETWRTVAFRGRLGIGKTIALVIGGYVASLMVNILIGWLAYALHFASPTLGLFNPIHHQPWVFALWLAVALCSAALGEELQFRGFLLSRLERLFGGGAVATTFAVIVQGAVFGIGHAYQGPVGILLTGGLGLVFGVLFLVARRNLIPSILIHAVVDTVGLTFLFLR